VLAHKNWFSKKFGGLAELGEDTWTLTNINKVFSFFNQLDVYRRII